MRAARSSPVRRIVSAFVAGMLSIQGTLAAASIEALGDLPNDGFLEAFASNLSADGSTLVGVSPELLT